MRGAGVTFATNVTHDRQRVLTEAVASTMAARSDASMLRRAIFAVGLTLFGVAFAMGLAQAWLSQRTLPSLEGDVLAQARATLVAGDAEKAVAQLRTYAHIEPGRAENWISLGEVLARLGQYNDAIVRYKEALGIDAKQDNIRTNLGIAYYKSGRFEPAQRELAQVAASQPTNYWARLMLGLCFFQMNRLADAAIALEPVVEAQPDNATAAYTLSMAYIGLRQLNKAEHLINKVFRQQKTVEAHLVLGSFYLANGETDKAIEELKAGYFSVEEYRSKISSLSEFPGGVATNGLPALMLIFHPYNVVNFEMTCEGLTRWNGKPAWQIHFRQRLDKPNTIKAYRLGAEGLSYPVALKGRAWILADSFQVARLETDLVAPVPQIKLFADHTAIEYGPVRFQNRNDEMWLPLSAEIFYDWRGHRSHRRHSFSNYLLFSIDEKQSISEPKTEK